MAKDPSQKMENDLLQVTLASFWKRLAAWVYDLLGGLAVFILAMVLGLAVIQGVATPWVEDRSALSSSLYANPFWSLYLLLCVQYYYVWCWVKGGQTVGMRTWRLKLCKPDGSLLSWQEAYLRSVVSLGGIAQIWSLFDKENRGLQDLACDSRVVQLPKGYDNPKQPLI